MTLCSDVSDSQLSSEIEGQGRAVSIQGFHSYFGITAGSALLVLVQTYSTNMYF